MAIIGPRQSGRSNTLAVLIDELRAPGGGELFVVNPRRSVALKTRAKSVTRYAETAEDAEALWRDLAAGIEERSRQFASGGLDGLTPLAVIIDDLDTLEIPFDANASLERAVLRGQDVGVTIFASANSLALRATYPSGLTKALLNLRAGLLLTPQTVDDFDLLAVRGRPSRMGPGRGYWCEGGTRHGVQVALASKAVPGTAK